MTTEAPPTNPHATFTAEGSHYTCNAPDCGYQMFVHTIRGNNTEEEVARFWASRWRESHADQYDTGRAPDIAVSWDVVAHCSVCPDEIGDIVVTDPETLTCKDCGTTWDHDGEQGERNQ